MAAAWLSTADRACLSGLGVSACAGGEGGECGERGERGERGEADVVRRGREAVGMGGRGGVTPSRRLRGVWIVQQAQSWRWSGWVGVGHMLSVRQGACGECGGIGGTACAAERRANARG
ncbi:hypothetical protein AB1Y20_022400 [Prymnesium parvum]|uniref:Uncharacterized protein n=1 Tax=Prymnesium parvum TaxID=97485 RepID=A0AB34JIQ3_PRYPA